MLTNLEERGVMTFKPQGTAHNPFNTLRKQIIFNGLELYLNTKSSKFTFLKFDNLWS